MLQEKEYFAFISYKREDEKWAKWLQDKLEHYRFPANLNGLTDLPKHIRPTFRDVTDLTPGLLAEKINNALHNSEWLIVLCSPRSAKSPWVCKEAQTFIDSGRADHIIPFVIEGNPFSKDSATECYPEALLNLTGSKELLAVNINDMGRDAAAVKVVASMFGLKFDTLWQRYEREKRKKLGLLVGSVALFAIIALVVAGFFMNMSRTISQQNTNLLQAAKRMHADSILQAQHIQQITEDSIALAQQNDSIQRQNVFIGRQKDEIAAERDNVRRAYVQLEQEKQRVLDARWVALKNESRAIAGNALSLVNTDALAASLIAIQTLPLNISNPDRPITAESEALLRNATTNRNRIFEGVNKVSFYEDGKKILINDGMIINTDNGLHVSSELSQNSNVTALRECSVAKKDHYMIISNVNKAFLADTLAVGDNLYYFKLSPDGKQLFTSYKDLTNIIWDVNNKVPLVTLKGLLGHVDIAEFNPVKKQLFTATRNMITLWDSESGIPTDTLRGLNNIVSASYSPNGDFVAAASYWGSSPSIIWKTVGGKEVDRYRIEGSAIRTVEFSPDGQSVLLTTSHNIASIWDVSHIYKIQGDIEGDDIKVLDIDNNNNLLYSNKDQLYYFKFDKKTHHPVYSSGWLRYPSYSSDGKYFVACDDKTIRIWDAISKKEIREIRGLNTFINSVSIAPTCDMIVSALKDSTIRFWNISTGKEWFKLREPEGDVQFAQISPNQKELISTSDNGIFRIWDIKQRKILQSKTYDSFHPVFSHDGNFIAFYRNDSIIVYNMLLGIQCGGFISTCATKGICGLGFCSKGEYLFACYPEEEPINEPFVVIYNWRTGIPVKIIKGKDTAAYSPTGDSILLSRTGERFLYLFNTKTWECFDSIDVKRTTIINTSFSPDSRYIIGWGTSCDYINYWDSQSKIKWNHGYYFKKKFSHCSFFQDGERALLAGDKMVIWDINKDEEIFAFECPDESISYASLSPNNKYVVTWSDFLYKAKAPIVWNVETGQKLFSLKHTKRVRHASFSSDSKYIVTACDNDCAFIWDVDKGDTICSLRGHTSDVLWASFSYDNKYVVTASSDHTAIIWNTETGNLIRILPHSSDVNMALFSKNGKYILTASSYSGPNTSNTIVWDFETGKQIKTYQCNYSTNALWGSNDNSIITWDKFCGVKIWDFPPLQELIDNTRERFKNRQLTPEERIKYYIE